MPASPIYLFSEQTHFRQIYFSPNYLPINMIRRHGQNKGGKNVLKRTHFIFPPTTRGRWPIPALRGVGLENNVALKRGPFQDTLKIPKRAIFLLPPSWRGDKGGSLLMSKNFSERTQLMALNCATITYSEFFELVYLLNPEANPLQASGIYSHAGDFITTGLKFI